MFKSIFSVQLKPQRRQHVYATHVQVYFLNSEVDAKNEWRGLYLPGLQVHGFLPNTGQPGPGLQLFPLHWSRLLLPPGHQEQGSENTGAQEEIKPLHASEKCQAESGVWCQEAAELSIPDLQWWWCWVAAFSRKGERSSGSRWTPDVSNSCAEGGDQAFWGRRCLSGKQTPCTFIGLEYFSSGCSSCSQSLWFDLVVKRPQMWEDFQLWEWLEMSRSWSPSSLHESAEEGPSTLSLSGVLLKWLWSYFLWDRALDKLVFSFSSIPLDFCSINYLK